MLVWRGAWHLWDHALGIQAPFSPAAQSAAQSAAELERGAWLCHGMGTLLLLLLDALRSLNTAPMFYASDSVHEHERRLRLPSRLHSHAHSRAHSPAARAPPPLHCSASPSLRLALAP